MCKFASFMHRPATGEVKVAVLHSHGETEEQLKLDPKIWREGHYTPQGEIELRLTEDDRVDKVEYETAFRNRFPDFVSFFNWSMQQVMKNGVYCDSLYLNGLTSLPEKIVLPKECDYLDLSGLTSLPEKIVLPKECGYLYLSGYLREKWNKILKTQLKLSKSK